MGYEYQYSVEVTDTGVTGWLETPESDLQKFGSEDFPSNERALRRKTIEVLRSWLNRWTALTRASQEGNYEQHLIVRDTFEVLGQHLYATIFFGKVEDGFKEARQAAIDKSATLRVLLRFDTAADDLAQLPWELLFANDDFLAAENKLVLSRSLSSEKGMSKEKISQDPPLVVQFLVTVPETEAYRQQREKLIAALRQPTKYSTSIRSEVLESWNQDEAISVLGRPPYPQVVHIIGVCRRTRSPVREGMEIYLDDGAGPQWRSGEVLVNLFSRNWDLAPEYRVRLVVLHLCEPSPLDFEATFEGLAPALVRQGIPAVIAMQYPLSEQAEGRFVRKLYEGLAERKSIEEAVQGARYDLFTTFEEDRLFGSPVLYMQSVDSQLLAPAAGGEAGANAGPSSFLAPPAITRLTLELLLQKLNALGEPPGPRDAVEAILRDPPEWPPQLSKVKRRVSGLVRDYAYQPEIARILAALVNAVQEEMSRRDFFLSGTVPSAPRRLPEPG
jgi:hypothetical protein